MKPLKILQVLKNNFIILNIFLVLSVEASSYSFCFDRSTDIGEARSYLKVITAPKDKIQVSKSSSCLETNIEKARVPLFKKFLQRRYRVRVGSAIAQKTPIGLGKVLTKNCNIKILKEFHSTMSQNTIKAGKKINISADSSSSIGKSESRLILGPNKKGYINIRGDRVGLMCFSRSNSTYNIDLDFVADSGMQINTSFSISRGEKINIGSIVDDLNKKNKKLDIKNGIEYGNIKSKSSSKYFIEVH